MTKSQIDSPVEILEGLLEIDPVSSTTISQILERFDKNGFLLTLVFFALPGIIPLPPGFTIILGIPLLIISFQMLLGHEKIILPRRVSNFRIKNSTLLLAIKKLIPILKKIESLLKPRFEAVHYILPKKIIPIFLLLSSICSMNPLPFTHSVPSLAIIIISLGSLRKDGVVIFIGVILAFCGILISVISIFTILLAVKSIFKFY
jgi:hypothetical protein